MIDLSTRYMGLTLKNPLIIASCGLTTTLQGVQNCANAGAGAIVLKSLFEEQIDVEVAELTKAAADLSHTEAIDYLEGYGHACGPNEYLQLIRAAKQSVDVPIIASINCISAHSWADYALQIAAAGADALEINVGFFPNAPGLSSADVEALHLDILHKVKARIELPVAMKIGANFSSFGQFAQRLGEGPQAVDALVLFNRFYSLDIDIQALKVVAGNPYSVQEEMHSSLRWIMLLAGNSNFDLAATTGIHDGNDLVKQLLAGATVAQICSTIYRNGFVQVNNILEQLRGWMETQGFKSITDFRGRLSQAKSEDPESYERLQYIKALTGLE